MFRSMMTIALLTLAVPAWAAPVTLVLGEPQRVTLGATTIQTEFQLPIGTRRVWIKWETNEGTFETSGSDEGTRDGTDFLTFDADVWVDLRPEQAGCGCPGGITSATSI